MANELATLNGVEIGSIGAFNGVDPGSIGAINHVPFVIGLTPFTITWSMTQRDFEGGKDDTLSGSLYLRSLATNNIIDTYTITYDDGFYMGSFTGVTEWAYIDSGSIVIKYGGVSVTTHRYFSVNFGTWYAGSISDAVGATATIDTEFYMNPI